MRIPKPGKSPNDVSLLHRIISLRPVIPKLNEKLLLKRLTKCRELQTLLKNRKKKTKFAQKSS